VKEATVNLLVFLLVFALSAVLLLGLYTLALLLIPGGRGLVFANPYAAALFPSLLVALTVAQARSVKHPGNFRLTWALQWIAFFFLLTLPLPWIDSMPPVRISDANPLRNHHFLPLQDGSQLLGSGQTSVLIPGDGQPMEVSQETQFDSLNQRFVFSNLPPKNLGSLDPEQEYYQFTPGLESLELDLLAVYSKLSKPQNLVILWFEAAVISWLFLGGYLLFGLRTWSLVKIVALLILIRLEIILMVYSLWSLPELLKIWIPGAPALIEWSPVVLIGLSASTLFFLTFLAKPHRAEFVT